MAARTKVVLSWSGGKDSALALRELRRDDRFEVVALLVTIAREFDRVSHHGVRSALVEAQARRVGLPLHRLELPKAQCTNEEYEAHLRNVLLDWRARAVETIAFGDLFLEDLRAYRERNLASLGMRGLFPLWKRDTSRLAREFVESGFEAFLACVDAAKLGRAFAGRKLNAALLRDLPADVDPCGENGEYHSFVSAGPIFASPIDVRVGEIVRRDVRYFADLVPADVSLESVDHL